MFSFKTMLTIKKKKRKKKAKKKKRKKNINRTNFT